ncbi:MAG: endonuclease/exonuclease/phosphatase family protein [Planctomycetota bacterium]|nr:endonuclease/exonuclease/phosphatase family protein [Planctomycetota bacterium]
MRLRLLSWNIHRCIGQDRRFDPDRVAAVLSHHQADVVLLQEVDRGVPRSRKLFLDHVLAEAARYPWTAWAQAHVLREGSYGNATLSRFPIVKRRHLDLRIGRRKQRNALYTRLSIPHQRAPLHVFNWHLGLSAGERIKQAARLLNTGTLRDLRENDRVIVGGDTNDWRNRLFLGAGIQQAGFHAWSEHGRRPSILTFPSDAPIGALDKFFWRGSFHHEHIHASRTSLARVASDHLPLVAEFDLQP